jgi:TfuA protein
MIDVTESPENIPRPVVFLGPSLSRIEAAKLLHAEFRPPIRRGDLPSLGPERLIVIIDGEFDQSRSVSLKEILRLLDAGGVVIGASSMGALRAAELAAEGMIGMGAIYEAYRTGAIEGDDEVALTYCPISFEPHTVPLVNVRFWLARLCNQGWISTVEQSSLLRKVRRIFFADRTPAKLSQLLEANLDASRIAAIRSTDLREIPDAKSEDARMALAAVARLNSAYCVPHTRRS